MFEVSENAVIKQQAYFIAFESRQKLSIKGVNPRHLDFSTNRNVNFSRVFKNSDFYWPPKEVSRVNPPLDGRKAEEKPKLRGML